MVVSKDSYLFVTSNYLTNSTDEELNVGLSLLQAVPGIGKDARLKFIVRNGIEKIYKEQNRRLIGRFAQELMSLPEGDLLTVLSPLSGEPALTEIRKAGWRRIRINGKEHFLDNIHDMPRKECSVELVIDRLFRLGNVVPRLEESITDALRYGNGQFSVMFGDGSKKHFCRTA